LASRFIRFWPAIHGILRGGRFKTTVNDHPGTVNRQPGRVNWSHFVDSTRIRGTFPPWQDFIESDNSIVETTIALRPGPFDAVLRTGRRRTRESHRPFNSASTEFSR
jgi:hypothetical protein